VFILANRSPVFATDELLVLIARDGWWTSS